ncbi:hypothetical protein O181_088253 [Austropuccinia psidii MF-1]|uniref:Uncharacterized protein n=1 Tax=Austropuccinia psidii MF-1 TaxID=1389203 RepID=A0A9Q3P2I0_9BASI|nr:hypothetical protein [Austropuccinia psidii MF-1]
MDNVEAKLNLDTGSFCTCVGKHYFQVILPEWENHLSTIEGVQFSRVSNNLYPLSILDTNLVFTSPVISVRMKTEIVAMDSCKFQHIILGNDHLTIHFIDINNHIDRYFTILENKRQKFASSNISKQISGVSPNKDTYREDFVTDYLVEAEINPSLSSKMRHELLDLLYTYKNSFSSDNELLGTIRGHQVDITLNIDILYPPVLPVLRRPAYSVSPRVREALEKDIQELIQLGVLRKIVHNEEREVKPPVIIACHNYK